MEDKSDWNPPQPQTLPRPTYWPVVLALGITLLAWGLVTYILVSGFGLLLFSIALAGWIAEVRGEHSISISRPEGGWPQAHQTGNSLPGDHEEQRDA